VRAAEAELALDLHVRRFLDLRNVPVTVKPIVRIRSGEGRKCQWIYFTPASTCRHFEHAAWRVAQRRFVPGASLTESQGWTRFREVGA
jgi:hypothetical protein